MRLALPLALLPPSSTDSPSPASASQIDRKDAIHQCYWLTFPHQDGPEFNHSNTVLDGEFVIDVDPETGKVRPPVLLLALPLFCKHSRPDVPSCRSQHIPRLLVFDLLVLDSENLMSKSLQKRYGVRPALSLSSLPRLRSVAELTSDTSSRRCSGYNPTSSSRTRSTSARSRPTFSPTSPSSASAPLSTRVEEEPQTDSMRAGSCARSRSCRTASRPSSATTCPSSCTATTASSSRAPRRPTRRARTRRCTLPSLTRSCPREALVPLEERGLTDLSRLPLPRLASPSRPPRLRNSLKWKPPSENSIDFVLQLKFPPKRDSEREPDFYAKPVFMLLMNHGHEGQHYYDTMEVDDETWETCVLLLLSLTSCVRACAPS